MRHFLVVVVVAMGVALSFPLSGSLAASHGGRVAVVDFYGANTAVLGDFPQHFAADDLAASLMGTAASLTSTGGDGFTVIPRGVVQAAESTMGWREDDVLRFARLRALAGALNADWLIVGRIPVLNVQWAGDGPHENVAAVVVQVFDAAAGRIVAETQQSASSINIGGGDPGELLRQALVPTIPWIMQTLTQTTVP